MTGSAPGAAPVTVTVLREPAMLALHALLVLVLAGTAAMGWWQLGMWRAAQADEVAERLTRSPVALGRVLGPDDALGNDDVGVPVVVAGRYAPAAEQFLVSGRELAGRDGFWVLSPLRVAATGSRLLVVRGWTSDGSALPPLPVGPVRVGGVLQPGEEGSGTVSAGRVVDAVRIPALVAAVDGDLYGAYLLRTPTSGAAASGAAASGTAASGTATSGTHPAGGLAAVPPPRPEASWSAGLRNLAYASQWWVFGAFGLFMWWRMVRDRLDAARAKAAGR